MKTILASVLVLPAPALALPQSTPPSRDDLKQLRPGQIIGDLDWNLKKVKRRFVCLTDEAIFFRDEKQQRSVEREEVFRVSVRGTSLCTGNMLLAAVAEALA